ncbi:MAG: peptide-methionine (S)-S-oxide reductase MsrA [Candidatus Altiarchaeota archaeon]
MGKKTPDYSRLEENPGLEVATFAGGCFWCMEAGFEPLEGVVEAVSGYTGGRDDDPTYDEVSTGSTGHLEAVQVYYDPEKISYRELVEEYWKNIDPTDAGGQFADRGSQYETAIFYHNEEQKRIADESKKMLQESGKYDSPIATKVIKFERFYTAEEYHQDYYKKNNVHYSAYKKGSGREGYIKRLWGD